VLSYLLAVLAACANATSSVLQRKANREVPKKQNLTPRLIWSLAHQPTWFGGVLAITAGFLLQAAALGHGQLSVVEPILVLELPATLILGGWVFRTRLGRREWACVLVMAVALGCLLYALSPKAGPKSGVHWYIWLTAIGLNLAVAGALVAYGRRGPAGGGRTDKKGSARQAGVLGVAAGSMFGLTAALMKAMTGTLAHGIVALVTHWPVYGMIVTGVLGMFLLQSAMNAGRLIAAQPGLTLSDPIVSVLWGVLVFGERVRLGWFAGLAVVSGLVVAGAVLVLIRSPLLSEDADEADEGHAEEGQPSARRRTVRSAGR
jgi:drug/metabolite transporter (DMT)-like permease